MIEIKKLGLCDYGEIFRQMKAYTCSRNEDSSDQLWVLQHHPVFTQGLAGKAHHLLKNSDIPTIQTDRGGQITYHGPGQLVIYPLLKLKRYNLTVRGLVNLIEQSTIRSLKRLSIAAYQKNTAPGVYVDESKIASLGLKISKGCSYHGLALNVDLDLTPFSYINPCGFENLQMTSIAKHTKIEFNQVEAIVIEEILAGLGYTSQH